MKKNKKTLKKVILILFGLLIIVVILLIIAFNKQKKVDTRTENEIKEEELVQEQIKSLRSKGEKERMQEYLIVYINYIETQQYEKAYNLLYQDFKDLYYPDLIFYTEYIKSNYFDIMRIDFEDIQRQGDYYILSVTLTDIMDDLNSKQQKFVIYEKGLNDFTLSFQAQ